jgi:uncharacterized membrane protein YfcA
MSFSLYLVLFLLATACGMGIGGGGLLVVYLTLVHASDQISAQALNLLFFIIAATASAIFKQRYHTKISLRPTLVCSLLALPGIFLGNAFRHSLPTNAIRLLFGTMLVLTGGIVLFRETKKYFAARKKRKFDEITDNS